MSQTRPPALHITKNLIIPSHQRDPLAEQHRVRLKPGYYAGQAVSFVRNHIDGLSFGAIVEMHGHLAELANGLMLPISQLNLVTSDEEWKPVEGFEGRYLLSSHGRVVSTQFRRTSRERLMSPAHHAGHPVVRLQMGAIREDVAIARLVATHFLPPAPAEAKRVSYRDGDSTNLRWDNLAWVVAGQGESHKYEGRPAASGEGHYLSKLTDQQVAQLRQAYAQGGVTHQQLADQYGVGRGTITKLVNQASRPSKKPTRS